jgi:hypothetical protein
LASITWNAPSCLDAFRMRSDMALRIACVVHAGKHANGDSMPVRYLSATLQAFPTQLKEDALLRVGQLRLARG